MACHLPDLGKVETKHGAKIEVVNLSKDEENAFFADGISLTSSRIQSGTRGTLMMRTATAGPKRASF